MESAEKRPEQNAVSSTAIQEDIFWVVQTTRGTFSAGDSSYLYAFSKKESAEIFLANYIRIIRGLSNGLKPEICSREWVEIMLMARMEGRRGVYLDYSGQGLAESTSIIKI